MAFAMLIFMRPTMCSKTEFIARTLHVFLGPGRKGVEVVIYIVSTCIYVSHLRVNQLLVSKHRHA